MPVPSHTLCCGCGWVGAACMPPRQASQPAPDPPWACKPPEGRVGVLSVCMSVLRQGACPAGGGAWRNQQGRNRQQDEEQRKTPKPGEMRAIPGACAGWV